MFEDLRAAGLLDRTIVVVTSDHGDEFLEHGKKGHRQSLYQEVLAVPLIFWAPKRVGSGAAATEASLIDVAPSILALTGVSALPGATGRPLFASDGTLLRDDRVAVSELRFNARRPALTSASAYPHKVIVDARKKVSVYFDLATDPAERSPRDANTIEEGRRLIGVLDRFYAAPERRPRPSANARKPLPDVMEERLRGLGYLD
jgi:arylsulfatase A-like enzyme